MDITELEEYGFFDDFPDGINLDRYLKKNSIDTFLIGFDNILDSSIDELIKAKKDDLLGKEKEIQQLKKEFSELNNDDEDSYLVVQAELMDVSEEIVYIQEVMFSLFEVKIIFAYKQFEITLKRFLSFAYTDKSINKSFKWQSFIDLLRSKEIDLNKLKGASEINDLRNANNSFKHSGEEVNNTIQNIKEFRTKEYLHYKDLEKFYARIKEYPKIFLNSLQAAVNDDLFEFSDDRLKSVAESFALRMDEDTAKKFADTFLKLYK